MKCIDDTEKCNSNGVWPFKFDVKTAKVSDKSIRVDVTLNRGWTPSHGGGKSLNNHMHYNVTIPVKVIKFDAKQVDVFKSANEQVVMDIVDKAPTKKSYKYDAKSEERTVFVGINQLGFELDRASDGPKDRGRYFETLQSFISKTYAADSNSISVDTT